MYDVCFFFLFFNEINLLFRGKNDSNKVFT